MKKTSLMAACLVPIAGVCSSAGSPPSVEITNGHLRVRLFLPDAKTGFYRGTRFDWSGVIGSLQYSGHEFYPPWFQRTDPAVHDFEYRGGEIVAGPCTALTGPSEEFVQALGYEEASSGGHFLKIGVGVLRKPDNAKYDIFHLYDLVDSGKWTFQNAPDAVTFRQELADQPTGFGYSYQKTVSLVKDSPKLILEHRLRNTGRRAIQTSAYNHNFLYVDRQPPGPGVSITVPFQIQASPAPDPKLARVRANRIEYLKPLSGEERVYFAISGFGQDSKDSDIRVEYERLGVGVRITSDRPLSRAALWSIRAPLSIEPFIDISLEPGAEFTWRTTYEYYTLATSQR
jgi:hypothetical protein